jgi:phenylacetate-CoA ligase
MTVTTNDTSWQQLRGRLQDAFLAGMPAQVPRMAWNAEQIFTAQSERLRKLLSHATRHSPFHRRRLAGINVDRVTPTDLRSLPVMTKADMMGALDDVFTDRRLTRSLAEEAIAATANQPVPILGEYLALASGGNSGQRGVFVYDCAALAQYYLLLARPLLAQLDRLGGPPPGGLPIAMVAAASPVHATGLAAAFAGAEMPLRILPAPVTLPVREIVTRLNNIQAPALTGYPTMLARLATEQACGRLHITPQAVTTTGETLRPEIRAAIGDAFHAPVMDNFGCTEGLVGASPPGESDLVFYSDLCIIELVDANNRPVPTGEASAKVLLTNLYNLTQPLIRYELTDIFVRQPTAPGQGHLRARVRGRSSEMLHYAGIDVHPFVLESVLIESPQVQDYQLRQTPHGIDVDAIATAEPDAQALSGRLTRALTRAGLEQPDVRLRLVDHLHRHPQTGKLRRLIPLDPVT